MKAKIILMTSLMAMSTLLLAQSYNSAVLSQGFSTSMSYQTIVRNWYDQWIVSYHSGSNGFFSCSDYSGILGAYSPSGFPANAFFCDTLPQQYHVNDFKILGDTLFFCGSINLGVSGPEGVIGWFELNDFISGSFNVHILRLDNTITLDKLVVYYQNAGTKAPGASKVVAIGTTHNPGYSHMIAEINNVTSALSYTYIPTFFDVATYPYEMFDDILYTQTNVVVTGRVMNGSFFIRVFDDVNSLPLSSNFNTIFFFSGTSEVNGFTKSATLESGDIAVSYVHYDLPSNSFTTMLRYFKTAMTPPGNFISQKFAKDDKEDPIDMVYSPDKKILTLLQTIRYIYNRNPQFIFLQPYNSLGYFSTLCHFNNNAVYNSLDLYQSKYSISVATNLSYLQLVTAQTNLGCPYSDPIYIGDLSLISLTPFSLGFTPIPNNPIDTLAIPISTYSGRWGTDCCTKN